MKRTRESSSANAQRGVTIVEVLVAVVVLSLGIVGVLGTNTKGFGNVNSSGHRAQATWLASQIIDRARANTKGVYAINFGSATGSTGQAATDLAAWKSLLSRTVPMGDGEIKEDIVIDASTGTKIRVFKVLVRWDDRRASSEGAAASSGPEYKYFVTETYLPAAP